MASGVYCFYALDVGLGVARTLASWLVAVVTVSMPSMSGWVLREAAINQLNGSVYPVSMPSMSGWVLRGQAQGGGHRQRQRFYALDVGLGVARGCFVSVPVSREDGGGCAILVWVGSVAGPRRRCGRAAGR